jgi:aspartyl-tRNA(Asn)/glutamyl-tRNA(Gln) amidotransferase subunit B
LRILEEGVISGKIAKSVFDEMGRTGKPAKRIVEDQGLVQITDTDALDEVILKIISNHPKEAQAYKNGKTKLLGFFVGQIMKETRGQANPKLANELLKEKLKNGVD